MKSYPADRVRVIGLAGHSGAGKTSLAEAMLFNSGELTRLGRTEDGNTVSDYDPEEKRRGISISLAAVPVEWQGVKLTMLDAPGYVDFMGDTYSAVSASDVVVLVMDAVSGVEVGTELGWQIAAERGVPVIIYVNKMARENASLESAMASLQTSFDARFLPMQLPIGKEAGFHGVVSLLSGKAWMDSDKAPKAAPDSLADDIEAARLELVETAAEGDDALMEKYFEDETLTSEEIVRGLQAGMRDGTVVPVFFGDATHNVGVTALMTTLSQLVPAYADSTGVPAIDAQGEEIMILPDASGPVILYVFKTVADPFVGKVTHVRVVSGELTMDEGRLYNHRAFEEERLGQLYITKGKDLENVDKLSLGDVGALAKLNVTITGDTLNPRNLNLSVTPPAYPNPLFEVAVFPVTQQDSAKMGPAMTRLQEQDPTLRWRFEPGTSQTILSGMGDIHIDVAVHNLHEKFGVGVETKIPKVPYKETISRSGTEVYRHKKQTGGAGQFAEVHMEVRPLESGAGFEYDTSRIFGGSISNSFFPSIEKGIRSILEQGVVAGYPVVDVKAEIYDGKMHPVDSKDIAFQIAGREAFRRAFEKSGPVLLEPVVTVKVTVPDDYVGDIIGDLNTRRAIVQGMGQERGKSVIEAQVPQAEMQRYAADLRSLTQGRGIYIVEPSHYSAVPSNIAHDIIEASRKEREEEK